MSADELTQQFVKRMQEIMDERGLVPKDIIKGIGISQPSYSQWVTGGARISATSRRKVAEFLNLPVEYLETGIKKHEYATARLVNNINDLTAIAQSVKSVRINPALDMLASQSSMTPTEYNAVYNQLESAWFANLENQPGLFAINMNNDAMYSSMIERSFNKGDQVIFDPMAEPIQGECLLAIINDELHFRRWVEINGVQVLTLLNPAYTEGSALRYPGSIYDIWAGTAISSVKKPLFSNL